MLVAIEGKQPIVYLAVEPTNYNDQYGKISLKMQ